MHYICNVCPGGDILPYSKYSSDDIDELAEIFELPDLNSAPRRTRRNILIARSLIIYGFEDSPAGRKYGRCLLANKGATISDLREQTCGIFGIDMSTGSHEELPKKRKQMSKNETPVGGKRAKIESSDWAVLQAAVSSPQGKALLQAFTKTSFATTQVQPPADATGNNDD